MIRTNLSTRPFYNEAAVHLWLAVFAALRFADRLQHPAFAALPSSDTRTATQASHDEQHKAELRRRRASPRELDSTVEAASAEAKEANDPIDRRTFPWTELFNRFESTPRQTSASPAQTEPQPRSRHGAHDRRAGAQRERCESFMENLSETGASGMLTTEERQPDTGRRGDSAGRVSAWNRGAKDRCREAPVTSLGETDHGGEAQRRAGWRSCFVNPSPLLPTGRGGQSGGGWRCVGGATARAQRPGGSRRSPARWFTGKARAERTERSTTRCSRRTGKPRAETLREPSRTRPKAGTWARRTQDVKKDQRTKDEKLQRLVISMVLQGSYEIFASSSTRSKVRLNSRSWTMWC